MSDLADERLIDPEESHETASESNSTSACEGLQEHDEEYDVDDEEAEESNDTDSECKSPQNKKKIKQQNGNETTYVVTGIQAIGVDLIHRDFTYLVNWKGYKTASWASEADFRGGRLLAYVHNLYEDEIRDKIQKQFKTESFAEKTASRIIKDKSAKTADKGKARTFQVLFANGTKAWLNNWELWTAQNGIRLFRDYMETRRAKSTVVLINKGCIGRPKKGQERTMKLCTVEIKPEVKKTPRSKSALSTATQQMNREKRNSRKLSRYSPEPETSQAKKPRIQLDDSGELPLFSVVKQEQPSPPPSPRPRLADGLDSQEFQDIHPSSSEQQSTAAPSPSFFQTSETQLDTQFSQDDAQSFSDQQTSTPESPSCSLLSKSLGSQENENMLPSSSSEQQSSSTPAPTTSQRAEGHSGSQIFNEAQQLSSAQQSSFSGLSTSKVSGETQDDSQTPQAVRGLSEHQKTNFVKFQARFRTAERTETYEEFSSRFFKTIQEHRKHAGNEVISVRIVYSGNRRMLKPIFEIDPSTMLMTRATVVNGYTPMHFAVIAAHEELVQLLLYLGCLVDKNVDLPIVMTPLELAFKLQKGNIFRRLLNAGASFQKVYDQALINVAVRKYKKIQAVFEVEEEALDHKFRLEKIVKSTYEPLTGCSLRKIFTSSFNDGINYHFQFNLESGDLPDAEIFLVFLVSGPDKEDNLCSVRCNNFPTVRVMPGVYKCFMLKNENDVDFIIQSDERRGRNRVVVQVLARFTSFPNATAMDEIDKKLEALIKELKKSGKPEDKEAYHSLVEVRIKRYQHLIENLKEKAECARIEECGDHIEEENPTIEVFRQSPVTFTTETGTSERRQPAMHTDHPTSSNGTSLKSHEEVLPNPEMQESTVDTSATLVHSAGTSTASASDTKQHQDDDNTDRQSDMRVDELTTAKDQDTSASSQILEDAIVIPAAAELPDEESSLLLVENKSEEQKTSIMEASKQHEDSRLHPMAGTPPLALSAYTQSSIDESSSLPNTAEKIQEENSKNEDFRQSPVAYTNALLAVERCQSAMNTVQPTPSHDTSSMANEDALSTTQSIQGLDPINSDNSGETNVNKSGARTDSGIEQLKYHSVESTVNLKNDLLEAEVNGSLALADTDFEAATVVKSIVDGHACAVPHTKNTASTAQPIENSDQELASVSQILKDFTTVAIPIMPVAEQRSSSAVATLESTVVTEGELLIADATQSLAQVDSVVPAAVLNKSNADEEENASGSRAENVLSEVQPGSLNQDPASDPQVLKSFTRITIPAVDPVIGQPKDSSVEPLQSAASVVKNAQSTAQHNGGVYAVSAKECHVVVPAVYDSEQRKHYAVQPRQSLHNVKSVLLSELPIRRLTQADISLLGLKQRNSTVGQHSSVPQAPSKSAASSVEPVESLGPVPERYSHAMNVSKKGADPISACTEQRKRRAMEEIRSAAFKRKNLCNTIATKITSSTISYNLDQAYVQSLWQRQHPLTLEAAVSAMHSGLTGSAGEEQSGSIPYSHPLFVHFNRLNTINSLTIQAAETQPSTSTTTSTNSVPPSTSRPIKIVKQNIADAHQQLKSNALYRSACDGQDEIVRQLIDAGHPIDTDYHATPLTAAFMRGHIKCMQYLLHAGADYQRLLKNNPSCVKEDVYKELMNFKQFIDYYMERYVIPCEATTLLTLHIPANDLQRRMISFSLKEEDLHRELFIYVFVITTSEVKGVVKSIVVNNVPAEKHKNSTKIFRVLNLKKENSIEVEFDHCGRRGQILGLSVLAK